MDKTLNRIYSLLPHKPDGKLVHGAKKELADKLNLESSVVTQWASGKNHSYNRYLYQIADLYGVSVTWLLGETDDPTPPPKPAPGGKTDIVQLLEENADRMPTADLLRLIETATDQLKKRE